MAATSPKETGQPRSGQDGIRDELRLVGTEEPGRVAVSQTAPIFPPRGTRASWRLETAPVPPDLVPGAGAVTTHIAPAVANRAERLALPKAGPADTASRPLGNVK